MPLSAVLIAIAPVIPLPLLRHAGRVSDLDLVELARSGDPKARHELYLRHVNAIAGRVTRLLSRSADAEDAVQDTFLEAFRDLGRLREPARFDAWLMRIAVHQAHRRLRRRQLLRRVGLDAMVDDATLEQLAAPDCDPALGVKLSQLDAVLRELEPARRLAWMLRMVEGCELSEVAEFCGCSLATAKRRIVSARQEIAMRVDLPLLDEVEP